MAADGNVNFEDSLNATNSLKLVNLVKGPQFLESHMCSGHFDITDLPMKPMDLSAASMKHYIEIINDVQMENVPHTSNSSKSFWKRDSMTYSLHSDSNRLVAWQLGVLHTTKWEEIFAKRHQPRQEGEGILHQIHLPW